MNDLFEEQLGFRLGVAKTTLMSLETDDFAQGTKSTSRKRTGALQEAFQFNDGDPKDCTELILDSDDLLAAIKSLHPDDVDQVSFMDFLTLNSDRHSNNLMVGSPGPNEGQTRLRPIDAGQMLPARTGFRRARRDMTAPMMREDELRVPRENQGLLMQLPSAGLKFSEKMQEMFDNFDPDAMTDQIKDQYEALGKDAPDMAGKISDESFDLMRKSGWFLKRAAKELTKHQISEVYAYGFEPIADARNQNELDQAIATAIAQSKRFTELGGAEALVARGVDHSCEGLELTDMVSLLEMANDPQANPVIEEVRVLQRKANSVRWSIEDSSNDLKQAVDQAIAAEPTSQEAITTHVLTLRQLFNYANGGGDRSLRTYLEGNNGAIEAELATPTLLGKLDILNDAVAFMQNGGYPALRRLLGEEPYREIENSRFSVHRDKLTDLVA
jgi:hypothetical protein